MKRTDTDGVTRAMPTRRRSSQKTDVTAYGPRMEVELTCEAPNAKTVFVAGDFNHWHARDLRLRRHQTGSWKVQVWLAPGRYEYRFIVDDEWQDDPHASSRAPNAFGSSNRVLRIPPLEVDV